MSESSQSFEEMASEIGKGLRPKGNTEDKQFSMDEVAVQEIREKLKDPTFLPTADQVLAAFPTTSESMGINMEWKWFCGENKIYQLLTKEMIEDLATQIVTKLNQILKGQGLQATPVTILELGAGDGRLSHFLNEEFRKRNLSQAIQVRATDDKSWEAKDMVAKTVFPVEKLSADEAVDTYAQKGRTILLSSWMPLGVNWTAQYLPHDNVDGMVLIGDKESSGDGDQIWSHDDYTTRWFTDNVRGNFSRAQFSPHNSDKRSEFAIISKEQD